MNNEKGIIHNQGNASRLCDQENISLNMKKTYLILLLLLGAFVLSACTGSRIAVNNWPGLTADSDRAYISTGSFLYAVDLKSGQQVWQYPAEADSKNIFFATPTLTDDGQLLVGSEGSNHALVSISAKTGKDNWASPFAGAKGGWVASPLVLNDRIYAPNTDGFMYVLDLDGKPAADPIDIGGALWSAPSTDGSSIYVTSLDHHIHVIDPLDNASIDPIDLGGAAPSSPVIVDGGAYVGSFASNIEFVTSKGEHNITATATNWVWGTPALDEDTLYYADLNGNMFSFDLKTKKQNWGEVKPDGPIVAKLLVEGGQIYAATEAGTFFALDKDANILWQKDLGGNIYSSPVAAGDLILVAPYKSDFVLAAYDADGKQAWTFTPQK